MAVAEPFEFVNDVAADFREEVDIADGLLREITTANRRATPAEYVYFARNLSWDEAKVKDELRRMSSVLRLESIAGRPEDREAASIEATTAEQVLAKESPKITEQIEKLQAKLRSIEADARLGRKRCEEQAEACRQLRALAPQHVRDAVRSAVQLLDNTAMRWILDAEVRANELECCLTPSRYPSEDAYLESLERSAHDAVVRVVTNNTFRRRLSAEWSTIKASMEAELAELRSELETKRADYNEKLAAIEKPLDHYAQGIA